MFPLFSIAYIDNQEDSNTTRAIVHTQSIRLISFRKASKSNCLELYYPPSKQILTHVVYKLDPTLIVGPIFNNKYNVGLFFNTYHNKEDIDMKPIYDLDSIVYIFPKANRSRYIATMIIGVPQQHSDIYTYLRMNNTHIIDIPGMNIYNSNPMVATTNTIKLQDTTLPS